MELTVVSLFMVSVVVLSAAIGGVTGKCSGRVGTARGIGIGLLLGLLAVTDYLYVRLAVFLVLPRFGMVVALSGLALITLTCAGTRPTDSAATKTSGWRVL